MLMEELKDRRVLVLDGGLRSALAVTRSLGHRGAFVVVGASDKDSLSAASKYVSAQLVYADPVFQSQNFIEDLLLAIDLHQITDLLPVSEVSLGTILANAERFSRVNLPFVPREIYEQAVDKHHLVKVAAELEISVPRSLYFESAAGFELAAEVFHYPVVLKPIKSRVFSEGQWLNTQVQYAHSAEELELRLQSHFQYDFPFMIQEFIEGAGAGVFFLYDHGREIARFSHRRLREKPPTGGVSVLSESQMADSRLFEQGARLLDRLNWHGAAMVEFKLAKDGHPYLMEINPRFWGSLQLAIDAGVDFPYLLLAMKSQSLIPIRTFREGVRLRWLLGDLDHAMLVLRSKKYSIGGKIKIVLSFFNVFSMRTKYETLRVNDMRPFFRELKLYVLDLIK